MAGSMDHSQGFRVTWAEDCDSHAGPPIRVARIHRADLFFDHWQKSASGQVARAFEEILRDEKPNLIHVHHWIRLTDDLVARAASLGIPACVTLHDLWTTCLVAFRVRPGDVEFCTSKLAPDPCVACAEGAPPRTPWLTTKEIGSRVEARREVLLRELQLARAVIVPCTAHASAITRYLGVPPDQYSLHVVPHGRDLEITKRPALKPPLRHGKLELSSWAHLHPLKGQDLLLTAIKLLPDPSRVRLHLLGGEPDAAYAASLREQAQGLDVVFHGPFDVNQLDSHPGTLVHAMVSGSRAHESWGLVVDEAVALGLPLILPNAGAFPDRMKEGVEFYNSNDAGDLARAIQVLLAPGAWEAQLAELPELEAVAPTMDTHVDALSEVYRRVLLAPGVPQGAIELASTEELDRRQAAWDAGLSSTPPAALGFAPGPNETEL
ncbi:MAG: glycosyltransferase involved in cell wall biosynthesis [Gammaproteobacteria bacterium]